jgi:hypothetical protein
MPKELMNIPWQATPVSLFGLSPSFDADSSVSQTTLFKCLLTIHCF